MTAPDLTAQIAAVERAIGVRQKQRASGLVIWNGYKVDDEIAALAAALATLLAVPALVTAARLIDKYSLVISSAVARCDRGNDAELTAMIRKVCVALLPFAHLPGPKEPGT